MATSNPNDLNTNEQAQPFVLLILQRSTVERPIDAMMVVKPIWVKVSGTALRRDGAYRWSYRKPPSGWRSSMPEPTDCWIVSV